MEVKLFGEFEVVREDVAIPVRGAKQRALLALLALNRGNPVSADRLIDQLWGDGQTANPANALQAQIGQLRRTLGTSAIVTSESGYALDISAADLDAARFEDLVAEGRRLSAEGEVARASAVLGDALRLRRGEPLSEFAYAGFADAERAHLNELALVATEYRVEADLQLGHHNELVGELEALCRDNPLRERLWELLMLALYRAGRQAEALRAYTEIRDRLVDELGIDPGSSLRELETRVLDHDPSLVAERSTAPRAPTPPSVPGNLPEPLGRFLGRDAELEQVGEAIASSRLVTLIGPGGVGKTRLAVEAAATARLRAQRPGGTWLIELAGVTDPGGVAPTAAGTLGAVRPALGDAQPSGSTAELIARHLAGRELLVVLDNCEHVIDEAASLAHTLVGNVPGLRLVATSREPLGVPGEILIPIGGLASPAAIELFVDRARAVQPGFEGDGPAKEIIDGVCRRLDGLPLAIELAAARLRALPLSTLAERLGDRFALLTRGARTALPRQQTLRAVVDWSYDLLFEDERRLFAQLSVFVGGCELEAVEAVCVDDELPSTEVLDVMSRLVDKSLVTAPTPGDTRFTQLQTLWEYGTTRLDESDEADMIRARHAGYYRRFAENANERLRGAAGPEWSARLNQELGNLKTALDWHLAAGNIDAALSLSSGLAWMWFINTDFAEGARWLASALDAEGTRRAELHATALVWHGYCVGMSSSPSVGLVECEEAIAVLRPHGDAIRLAEALLLGASVLVRAHQFDRSLAALAEAQMLLGPDDQRWLRHSPEDTMETQMLLGPHEHGWLLATHDMLVSWNMASFGRLDEAEEAALSSIARYETAGEVLLVVNSLNALAGIAAAKGDLEGAAAAYEALLERCRATGQHPYLPFCLVSFATVRARQGDDAAADHLYQEAIECCYNPWLSADAMVGQAAVARHLGDLLRARGLLDAAAERYRDADLPAGQARVLAGLAWWAIGADQPAAAVIFAVDAVRTAKAVGDPESQLLADSALAAANAVADPTQRNTDSIVALAQQRASGLSHRSLTDERDLVALATRLAPTEP
ncbi:MAG: BTAD domain-containing putative transcriptional regulator [Acidimicrobiales bacterium]